MAVGQNEVSRLFFGAAVKSGHDENGQDK